MARHDPRRPQPNLLMMCVSAINPNMARHDPRRTPTVGRGRNMSPINPNMARHDPRLDQAIDLEERRALSTQTWLGMIRDPK